MIPVVVAQAIERVMRPVPHIAEQSVHGPAVHTWRCSVDGDGETLVDSVTLCVNDGDDDTVGDDETLAVVDCVMLCVTDGDDETVGDGETLTLVDSVTLCVTDGDVDTVGDGETLTLVDCVMLCVNDGDREYVAVLVLVGDVVAVGDEHMALPAVEYCPAPQLPLQADVASPAVLPNSPALQFVQAAAPAREY